MPVLSVDDNLKQFFEEHNIEGNKFESFEAAEAFFRNEGFVIDKEAAPESVRPDSLTYMLQSASPDQLEYLKKVGKMRATWRLKLKTPG